MTSPLRRAAHNALAATGLRSRARERPDARALAPPDGPPSTRAVLSELGSGLAAARIAGALPRLLAAPRGERQPVVDIPGGRRRRSPEHRCGPTSGAGVRRAAAGASAPTR